MSHTSSMGKLSFPAHYNINLLVYCLGTEHSYIYKLQRNSLSFVVLALDKFSAHSLSRPKTKFKTLSLQYTCNIMLLCALYLELLPLNKLETMVNNASLMSKVFATDAWQEYTTKLNKADKTCKHTMQHCKPCK